MRIFILAIATAGGSGYAPIASGTFGSAVGLLLWWAIAGLGTAAHAIALVLVVLLGVWAADRAQTIFRRHDDGRITIAGFADDGHQLAAALGPNALPDLSEDPELSGTADEAHVVASLGCVSYAEEAVRGDQV